MSACEGPLSNCTGNEGQGGWPEGRQLICHERARHLSNSLVPQFPLCIMVILVPFQVNVEDEMGQHTEYCWL